MRTSEQLEELAKLERQNVGSLQERGKKLSAGTSKVRGMYMYMCMCMCI